MSQKTRAALVTEIDNKIYTNVTQDIEGDELNSVLKDQNDSYANLISDKLLFNLRNYSSTRGTYEVGEYAVQGGILYECITATSGAFNASHWSAISTAVAWGDITGTVTDQADLVAYLEANYVDLLNNQSISGEKTFNNDLIVVSNILPDADLGSDLGSSAERFSQAFINDVFGSRYDTVSMGGTLAVGALNAQVVNIATASGNTVVNIGTAGTNVITIGNSNSQVNILGSVLYEDVTNLQVKDKLITLNKGGAASSATGTGIEFEENAVITGYIKTTGGRDGFLFKSPANAADSSFIFTATSARSYTFPDSSGTVLLTPSFTDGSVIYWNAGFAQSNSTFFFDPANTILFVGANSNPLSLLNLKAYFQGNVNSYSQINSINTNAGTTASGDIVISADTATDSTKYVNLGINSSGNTSTGVLGGALTAYLYVADGDFAFGTSTAKDLKFFTGGTATSNERFRTTAFGWTGFNQSTKLAQVSITQVADFVATGTTTASATGSITGIGTRFLSEISVGDQISLSSAPSTYFVVTAITSDTALTVTNTMGNGTSQTINVKKSPFSIISNTGTNYFLMSSVGTIGMGQVPVSTVTLGITSSGNSIVVASSAGVGITATGTTGGSFQGTTTGVIAGTTSSNVLTPALVARKIQNTNSNERVLEVAKYLSSGVATTGIAAYVFFAMADNSTTVAQDFGKFGIVSTDVTAGSVRGDFTWGLMVSNTMTERMRLSNVGNIGLGTSTFGTSMTFGVAVKGGTAPSTDITDVAQMYVNDITAGNAAFHFRTENSAIIKLYQQANNIAIDTILENTGFKATGGTSIFDLPIAVKAGASSGNIAKVGGVIHTNTTTTGNVGAGEDTLFTYSVPAATLNTNKESIIATVAGFFGASANNKTLKVKFGATTIFDSGALPLTLLSSWIAKIEIIRTGAATQKCNVTLSFASATMANYTTSSETLSGAVNLVVTGEGTSDNDIVGEILKVRWEPAE